MFLITVCPLGYKVSEATQIGVIGSSGLLPELQVVGLGDCMTEMLLSVPE